MDRSESRWSRVTTTIAVVVLASVLPSAAEATGIWSSEDGDVLVVSADELADDLAPLLDDLAGRGFRPTLTTVGTILEEYTPLAFPEAAREAVGEACRSFASHPLALILVGTASEDVPANDRLPTRHVTYEHDLPYYDTTYAEDFGFAVLPDAPEGRPDLLVGRIPARSGVEVAAYVAKLQAYRSQPEDPTVLLAVGDANLNADCGVWRTAAQSLLSELQRTGVLEGVAQYASDAMPLNEEGRRRYALDLFQARLEGGVGLVELFGNNTGPTNAVQMFNVPPATRQPWLLPEEMETEGRLPIAVFQTCLNGAFDEDGYFPGYDAPAETWVREPARGAVAVLAQSHITAVFPDWEFLSILHGALSNGCRWPLGAAQVQAKWLMIQEGSSDEARQASARMSTLLGDPLLVPKLGVQQQRLACSFEPFGNLALQNEVVTLHSWTTGDFIEECARARIVHGGIQEGLCDDGNEAEIDPIEGERMLQVTGRHGSGTGCRGAAWRILDCDLQVEPGSVLRYWVRQEVDPRGRGRLALDAEDEDGNLLSDFLTDFRGLPADPRNYDYALGQWRRIDLRLDAWEGRTIRSLFLRFEDPIRPSPPPFIEEGGPDRELARSDGGGEGGVFSGYVDAIRIDTGYDDLILDGAFEEDEDADLHPDAWLAPWPGSRSLRKTSALRMEMDGEGFVLLDPGQQAPAGIAQAVAAGLVEATVACEATGEPGAVLSIELVDPADGTVLSSENLSNLADYWRPEAVQLGLEVSQTCLLQLRPVAGTVAVRRLQVSHSVPTRSNEVERGRSRSAWVENPIGRPCRVRFGSVKPPTSIELFDLSGRRIAVRVWPTGGAKLGVGVWDLGKELSGRLTAGVYFVRIRGAGWVEDHPVRVVR